MTDWGDRAVCVLMCLVVACLTTLLVSLTAWIAVYAWRDLVGGAG